jgi:hypothetical protein
VQLPDPSSSCEGLLECTFEEDANDDCDVWAAGGNGVGAVHRKSAGLDRPPWHLSQEGGARRTVLRPAHRACVFL